MNNQCVDCGSPTGGIRCRICNGRQNAVLAAQAAATDDRVLLHQRDAEGIPVARLAARYGITPQRMYRRIQGARRRQALLI
jgi:hypothetical protein